MNTLEVLVLNGSPGSGKTTLANAISECLREVDIAHVVIDVDELSRIYPEHYHLLQWNNLAAIWSNYLDIQNLKVILPVLIDSDKDLRLLRHATPSQKFTICELTADDSILKDRVTKREPNEYWQSKLRSLVDNYSGRDVSNKFGDFKVNTGSKSVDDTAQEIIKYLDWK